MRSVGLKILKNKLSEYVRLAAGGETIMVTDRDRVVAELGPPEPGHTTLSDDDGYAELVRRGVVTPARYPPGLPPRGKPIMTFDDLMMEIGTDREDR